MISKRRPASVRNGLIEDPLVYELRRQKCLAAKNVKIEASGEHAEIDVAATVDDVLLILECKASLLPCNIFELRTSHDAIQTAVTQLDRIRRILADPVAKTRLLERLDARGRMFRKILTGIVVENRLFSGLKPNGHLVVTQAHLLNIIEGGDMRIGNAWVPIRSREPLSAAIEDFMSGGLYKPIFDSMMNHQRSYPAESGTIVYDTYLLDIAAFARKYGVELAIESPDGST
jgi:hypothetical protein